MARPALQALSTPQERLLEAARQVALVVGASLFVALCARITIPLPFTPVPLTVQNFGVLLVGLLLGSRRGFAALILYLAEGAMGMPVFSPSSVGLMGVAQIIRWWRGWRDLFSNVGQRVLRGPRSLVCWLRLFCLRVG
jgi:uncharacterized membrane protein